MMKRHIAEQYITQDVLTENPEVRSLVKKNLSEHLLLELMEKYKPGQCVAVQFPREMLSSYEPLTNGTYIRVALFSQELIQCKNCDYWGSYDAYTATHNDNLRSTCRKNLRQDTVFASLGYAIKFATDFCSEAKRR